MSCVLVKLGGVRLAAALFVSVNTAGKIHRPPLKKKPPVSESHRGKRTLLPYSVLLWQAASPGSSVSHVSSQRHNTPVPSGVKLGTHRYKVLFIHMKLCVYMKAPLIKDVSYVTTLHVEMQDYKDKSFTLVLFSVFCSLVVYKPSLTRHKPKNHGHCGLQTATPAAFCCMSLLLRMFLVRLLHFRNNQHLGTCNRKTQTLN